ncbi:hypothetical protein H072_10058 [Dactylellina haptotyla CBS 200.50]|uniref:Ribosomal protein L34 n=1 Tax=Dactylellina haptotyla (strain CBS 200.50) TaxID=1284197 RepID=S8A5N0_DACHA|nr:hypothetical protein H072_10058 [Dactylellina haptotyla CBS 200.50]
MAFLRRPALVYLRYSTSATYTPFLTSTSRRTFTSLLRPATLSSTTAAPFARPTLPSVTAFATPLLQSSAPITPCSSSSSSLLSLTQARGHRRKTYNPSHLVRKRRFGFLARLRSKTGRNILKRRKETGRKHLTH